MKWWKRWQAANNFYVFFSMRRLGKCHRSYLLQGTYWYFYFAWYWNWRWKKYMIEIIDFQFLPHDQVNVEPTPQIKSSVSTFSFWVTDTADYIIKKVYLHILCHRPSVDNQPGKYSNILLHNYCIYIHSHPSQANYIHRHLHTHKEKKNYYVIWNMTIFSINLLLIFTNISHWPDSRSV